MIEVLVPGTPTELGITHVLRHWQDQGLCAELLHGLLPPRGGDGLHGLLPGEDHWSLVTPTPPASLTCPPSACPDLCYEAVLVTKGGIQPGCKQAELTEVKLHMGCASLLVLPANLES